MKCFAGGDLWFACGLAVAFKTTSRRGRKVVGASADLILGVILSVGYAFVGWRAEREARASEFFALWWYASAAASMLTTALWWVRGAVADDALVSTLGLAAILAFGIALAALASGLVASWRAQGWALWALLASCAMTFALFAGGAWLGVPGGFLGLLLMPMLLGAVTAAILGGADRAGAPRRIRWH